MIGEGRAGGTDPAGSRTAREAFDKALELLAPRPHFVFELAFKLRRRGYADEAVDECLARLTELGYLDDLKTGRSFCRQRVARSDWGPRRLRAELGKRGVGAELATTLVDESFPDGERPAARAAAARWSRTRGRGDAERQRERLARYLDRRGFSKGTIVEMLSELATDREQRLEIGHEQF